MPRDENSSCGFVFYTAFVKDLAKSLSWRAPRAVRARVLAFLAIALLASIAKAQSSSGKQTAGFRTLSAQADAARDADRLDDAVGLYKKALALRPSWSEGWWSLGTIQYDRNAYDEATRSFRKLTALAPKNGNAFAMLGLSEFELGKERTALEHIRRGVDLGVNKDASFQQVLLYHEGVLEQRLGRFESAREMLQQLCVQGVHSEEVVTALGLSSLRLRVKSLKEAPPPAEIVTLTGRGACLTGEKKFEDARKEMQIAVDQDPKYPRVHYAVGLITTLRLRNSSARLRTILPTWLVGCRLRQLPTRRIRQSAYLTPKRQ